MNEHIVINKDRSVVVPISEKKIGIQYDHNVNKITFDCPRYADDNEAIDMSRMHVFLNYMLPDKTTGCTILENVVVDETDPAIIHFDWVVTRNHTRVKGVMSTLICIKQTDTEGTELYHWNTDLFQQFIVGDGMECGKIVVDENPDVITQLLVRMDAVDARTSTEAIQGYVNNYLTEHPVSPTEEQMKQGVAANSEMFQSSVDDYLGRNPLQLDNGLTETTKAAPANKVGEIQSDVTDLKGDMAEIVEKHKSVNLFNKNSELLKSDKFIQGSGGFNNLSRSFVSHPIRVELGKTYTFNINKDFYGSNALVVRNCNEDGTLFDNSSGFLATDNGDGSATFTISISQYTDYLCVNVRTPSTMMFVEGTSLPEEYKNYFEPYTSIKKEVLPGYDKILNNPLYGETLSLNGDSICYGAGSTGGYGSIIGANNNMIVSNIALTGGTIASGTTYSSGGNRHWISRTIANMPISKYNLVEGGSNDVSLGVPLGALSSGYIATLDDSTFYGAMESVCKQMITRFKGTKYAFIIAHQMKGGMQISSPYYKAIIECCEKWGVPICDLAKNCVPFGLFEKDWGNELSNLRNTYTANDGTGYGDGWHPNEECYKMYYVPKIESCMRSL